MKIRQTNSPVSQKLAAFVNTYNKSRYPGLIFGFDNSKLKIGRQMTKNWCGSVLSQIKVPWTHEPLSREKMRTILKSTFFPFNFIVSINKHLGVDTFHFGQVIPETQQSSFPKLRDVLFLLWSIELGSKFIETR